MKKRMNRAFYFLLLTVAAIACTEKERLERKPNIVFIMADDLGWKDLGCMGSDYYETPNIDKLAGEGLLYLNAYAGAANCAPSRACLISGLNSPRTGVYTVGSSDRGKSETRRLIPVVNEPFLQDSVYTLPEMMQSAGYITGNFGKWHVGMDPADQGIMVNAGGGKNGNPGKNGYFSPYNVPHLPDGPAGEYLTDRLTNEALDFMEKYRDTTFFMYVPFYTVHSPILPKKDLEKHFRDKPVSGGQHRADYAAMIASLDENVGRIMVKLKELGLQDNTLVVFTSDNGGVRAVTSQAPLRAGKGSYYEGGIRVPLIIRWPGKIVSGSISQQRVVNLDFFPTFQRIVQPKKPKNYLDGVDLSPTFQGNRLEDRDLYFHFPIYLESKQRKVQVDGFRDSLFRTRPGSVIISGDWKLHEYFEDSSFELFDLGRDESEAHNLSKEFPDKVLQLRKKLHDWRQYTSAPVPTETNPEFNPDYENKN